MSATHHRASGSHIGKTVQPRHTPNDVARPEAERRAARGEGLAATAIVTILIGGVGLLILSGLLSLAGCTPIACSNEAGCPHNAVGQSHLSLAREDSVTEGDATSLVGRIGEGGCAAA